MTATIDITATANTNDAWKQLLMQEYGQTVSFINQDTAVLSIADTLINIEQHNEQLFCYTSLGVLPSDAGAALYDILLQENFLGLATRGGHIGVHKDTRIITYSVTLDFATVDAYKLRNCIENFVQKAQEELQCIQDINPNTNEDDGNMLAGISLNNVLWG